MIASGTIITEANRADWLAQRSQSLGASEAAAALGVSPWQSPVDLWQRKLGIVGGVEENEAMRWGSILEPVIIQEYSRRVASPVMDRQLFLEHGMFEWMTCTLDGSVFNHPLGWRALEIKTASAMSEGWGEDGSHIIPDHYRVQVMHQLAIFGRASGADVAALLGGQELRIYHIERDEALIAQIIEGERKFWECVQTRTPPTWGKLDPRILAILNPECHGEVELGPETLDLVMEDTEILKRIKRDKERTDEIKIEILKAMGRAQIGTIRGKPLIKRYLRQNPERTQVVKAHPVHYFSVLKQKELT